MESAVAYRQLDPDSSPAVQEEDGTTLTRHGIRESRHAAAAGLGDISLGPLDDEDDTGLVCSLMRVPHCSFADCMYACRYSIFPPMPLFVSKLDEEEYDSVPNRGFQVGNCSAC